MSTNVTLSHHKNKKKPKEHTNNNLKASDNLTQVMCFEMNLREGTRGLRNIKHVLLGARAHKTECVFFFFLSNCNIQSAAVLWDKYTATRMRNNSDPLYVPPALLYASFHL
ncbi:unnamed protein product [Ixodes persulcatus]